MERCWGSLEPRFRVEQGQHSGHVAQDIGATSWRAEHHLGAARVVLGPFSTPEAAATALMRHLQKGSKK